jgi:hypothetical protein
MGALHLVPTWLALANAPPPRHLALTFANINNRNNKTMDSVSNNIPSAKREGTNM